jgi:hypothetical protein
MVGRGGSGMARGSGGLGAIDMISIVLVIVILGTSLGVLLTGRDSRFAARAQDWMRLVAAHLTPSLFLPNQAAAEDPPLGRQRPGS